MWGVLTALTVLTRHGRRGAHRSRRACSAAARWPSSFVDRRAAGAARGRDRRRDGPAAWGALPCSHRGGCRRGAGVRRGPAGQPNAFRGPSAALVSSDWTRSRRRSPSATSRKSYPGPARRRRGAACSCSARWSTATSCANADRAQALLAEVQAGAGVGGAVGGRCVSGGRIAREMPRRPRPQPRRAVRPAAGAPRTRGPRAGRARRSSRRSTRPARWPREGPRRGRGARGQARCGIPVGLGIDELPALVARQPR